MNLFVHLLVQKLEIQIIPYIIVMMIGGMILHLLIVLEKMMISGVGGFGMYLW